MELHVSQDVDHAIGGAMAHLDVTLVVPVTCHLFKTVWLRPLGLGSAGWYSRWRLRLASETAAPELSCNPASGLLLCLEQGLTASRGVGEPRDAGTPTVALSGHAPGHLLRHHATRAVQRVRRKAISLYAWSSWASRCSERKRSMASS